MELLIGIFVGVTMTLIFSNVRRRKPSGSFVIDMTDPMKDLCKLELGESLDAICMRKQITFNVKVLGGDD